MSTISELIQSARDGEQMPAGLSVELQSLWHAKVGNWDEAHDLAQDIHSPTGSWIHAMLHLIEGDVGNAGYWFRKSGKPARSVEDIDGLWTEIADTLTDG
jgi:hypothetical protein